jgi:formylglycine-generating enzyme required for sulfatase activity
MKHWMMLVALGLFASAGPALAASVSLQPGAVFRDCPDCPEMVVVPPGSFAMGRDGGVSEERYEGPVRDVNVAYSFAAGRYEVTNAEYRRFVDATGYDAQEGCNYYQEGTWVKDMALSWLDPGYGRPIKPDEPAVCLAWYHVKAYVDWLAEETGQPYRLLSEAEWEYLANAPPAGPLATAQRGDELCPYANILDQSGARVVEPFGIYQPVACDDGHERQAPVGSFPPNAYGLYDVVGNIWEWTEDCYAMPIPAEPVDGSPQLTEGCDRRAVKGGSWGSALTWQRPSFRGRDPLSRVSQVFGFRIARDLTQ